MKPIKLQSQRLRILLGTRFPRGWPLPFNPRVDWIQVEYGTPRYWRELARAHGVVTLLSHKIDAAFLKRAPLLRVVAQYAVGYENIDLAACEKCNVRIVNTPGVLTRSTAECAATLLLSCARRTREGMELCNRGAFKGWKPDLYLGIELKNKHAVLVGEGRIGMETAKLFRALGMKTHFISRNTSIANINRLLCLAEVLSLHMAYRPELKHWLNSKRLALLPKNSIVINTARGALIDEKALARQLVRGHLFAVGLDVFEREPSIEPILKKHPRAHLLPHLGSATVEARIQMFRLATQSCLQLLLGKNVKNEVT